MQFKSTRPLRQKKYGTEMRIPTQKYVLNKRRSEKNFTRRRAFELTLHVWEGRGGEMEKGERQHQPGYISAEEVYAGDGYREWRWAFFDSRMPPPLCIKCFLYQKYNSPPRRYPESNLLPPPGPLFQGGSQLCHDLSQDRVGGAPCVPLCVVL